MLTNDEQCILILGNGRHAACAWKVSIDRSFHRVKYGAAFSWALICNA